MSYKTRAAKRARRATTKKKAGMVLAHKSETRSAYYGRKDSSQEIREIRRVQRRGIVWKPK